jgi:hypothetical protein
MSQLTTTEPPLTPVERVMRRNQWIIRGLLLLLILWLLLGD